LGFGIFPCNIPASDESLRVRAAISSLSHIAFMAWCIIKYGYLFIFISHCTTDVLEYISVSFEAVREKSTNLNFMPEIGCMDWRGASEFLLPT
jgi:uncharacterized membrane protein YesL